MTQPISESSHRKTSQAHAAATFSLHETRNIGSHASCYLCRLPMMERPSRRAIHFCWPGRQGSQVQALQHKQDHPQSLRPSTWRNFRTIYPECMFGLCWLVPGMPLCGSRNDRPQASILLPSRGYIQLLYHWGSRIFCSLPQIQYNQRKTKGCFQHGLVYREPTGNLSASL